MSHFRRGPVAVPWADYNQVPTLFGEDLGVIIRLDVEPVMGRLNVAAWEYNVVPLGSIL